MVLSQANENVAPYAGLGMYVIVHPLGAITITAEEYENGKRVLELRELAIFLHSQGSG